MLKGWKPQTIKNVGLLKWPNHYISRENCMRITYECRSDTLTLYNKRQCECYYCNNLTWTKIGIPNSFTSLICLCARLFHTISNIYMYFVLEIWILRNYLVFKPWFFWIPIQSIWFFPWWKMNQIQTQLVIFEQISGQWVKTTFHI